MRYGPSNPRQYDVLLLASYCGDENPDCTDAQPCSDCLPMCNVVRVKGEDVRLGRNFGGMERSRSTRLCHPPRQR